MTNFEFMGKFTTQQKNTINDTLGKNIALYSGGNSKADGKDVKTILTLFDDGTIGISQSDGDKFALRDLAQSGEGRFYLDELKPDELEKLDPTAPVKPADPAKPTAPTGSLEDQIKQLERQKAENNIRIDVLDKEIQKLQTEIMKDIEEALKDIENITEEQQKDATRITEDYLKQYTDGKITYEQMQAGMKGDLTGLDSTMGPKIASAVSNLMNASSKMGVLQNHVAEMGKLIQANADIDSQISGLQKQIAEEAARKATEEAQRQAQASKSCDPIGFTKEGMRYDFFIDKDNNGDITNAKEFLGADNQWAEMQALDKKGADGKDGADGKVAAGELADAGVKVLVTDEKTGKQSIKTVAELGIDNIDLNSYKDQGSKDIGRNNKLLGNFSLTMGGNTIEGYNTLDDMDYLNEYYEFTDENKANAQGVEAKTLGADGKATTPRFEEIKKLATELQERLDAAWLTLTGDEKEMKTIRDLALVIGEKEGEVAKANKEVEAEAQKRIKAELKEEETKNTDTTNVQTQKEETAKDATTTDTTTTAVNDTEKKLLEEATK